MSSELFLQPSSVIDLPFLKTSVGPIPAPSAEAIANAFSCSRRIALNVGGSRHEVMWRTLQRLPRTRLGQLETCRTHGDILALCDDYTLPEKQADGRWSLLEFYFERHTRSFELLLDLYRTGHLHIDEEVCIMSLGDEFAYWGVDQLYMERCCAARYHQRREQLEDEMRKETEYLKVAEVDDFGTGFCWSWRKTAWDIMEKPETSYLARATAFVSITFVLLSTVILTMNTIPEWQEEVKQNITLPSTLQPPDEDSSSTPGSLNITITRVVRRHEHRVFTIGEYVCITWFTFEYLVRLWACPSKKKFWYSPLNWIDLLSILPFYVSLALHESDNISEDRAETLDTMRRVAPIFRIMRVLRVLKLARHFTGLQSLGYTLQRSYKELGLLVLFLAIAVLLFSSILFYCEKDQVGTKYTSIPASFWWAVVSMCTVGYGDMAPETAVGKLFASLCCVAGVLVIALPNPVIVNNFIEYYQELRQREKLQKRREELDKRKQEMNSSSSRDFLNLDRVFARSMDFINRLALRDGTSRESTPTRSDSKRKSFKEGTPSSENRSIHKESFSNEMESGTIDKENAMASSAGDVKLKDDSRGKRRTFVEDTKDDSGKSKKKAKRTE